MPNQQTSNKQHITKHTTNNPLKILTVLCKFFLQFIGYGKNGGYFYKS